MYVSRKEALEIAESVLRQIRTGDVNSGRAEFTMSDGSYFSLTVDDVRAAEP